MDNIQLDLTMDPTEEDRCRKRFRPIIKKYINRTKCTYSECERLLMIFHKLSRRQPIDRKYFRRIMFDLFEFQNDLLMDRIFSAFDRNNKLVITMDAWLIGMSVMLRGDLEDKMKFCFNVYDMMADGFIKREHMYQALKTSLRPNPDEDPEEMTRDLIELIMKKMDHDRDGKISFEDYRTTVLATPSLIEFLGYCLPARPACYKFMTTFADKVSTMHGRKKYHKLIPF